MATSTEIVPREVSLKILSFLNAGKTGNITLHVKEGRIMGWELKETGRLDNQR